MKIVIESFYIVFIFVFAYNSQVILQEHITFLTIIPKSFFRGTLGVVLKRFKASFGYENCKLKFLYCIYKAKSCFK